MDSKENILRTSFQLFVEKGFTDVSLNEIIKAVGLTKGGFYYYFESKEALLVAVIDRYLFSYLAERLTLLKTGPGTVQEKVEQFFQGILSFERTLRQGWDGLSIDFRAFYLLLMEGVKKFVPLAERYALFHTKMRETIVEILDQGKKEGTVSNSGNSMDMAFLIMSVAEGLLLQWVVNPEIDINRQSDSTFEFVWSCVGQTYI